MLRPTLAPPSTSMYLSLMLLMVGETREDPYAYHVVVAIKGIKGVGSIHLLE
jgi:hypothetical protein